MTQAGLDTGLFAADIAASSFNRAAEIHEVVEPIMFLISPSSGFIYGQALVIDGGYSLWDTFDLCIAISYL
jgi:NAD(P)-dependent dehydrogenase (short-subunit alcohol dehydrogenase family)